MVAAIGGGSQSASDVQINISGGTVNATGNIGHYNYNGRSEVSITGGTVNTDENIGTNYGKTTVSISNGIVNAGQGVGTYEGNTDTTVNITGGTVTAGKYIGSYDTSAPAKVYISGGSVNSPAISNIPVVGSSDPMVVHKTKLHFDDYANAAVLLLKVTQDGVTVPYGAGPFNQYMTDGDGNIYLYLPPDDGDTVADVDINTSTGNISHLSYHGTVTWTNNNFLKQDQRPIEISGMQPQYIQGTAVSPSISGGSSSGGVTYT